MALHGGVYDLPSVLTALDVPLWLVRVFAFAWGAAWGSFANVAIYRWPRELSLVHPGSRCPHCEHPVRAYDNVPILAWLWLRGRCRDCRAPISPRYPIVELLYAVVSLALAERIFQGDPSPALSVALALWMVRYAFAWGLLTASFIDLETMLIPDMITYPGIALGLAAAWLLPGVGIFDATFGGCLGFALPFGLYFTWKYVLKRGEGMGLGDAKLLAMVGAFLGPAGVVFALGTGALQGLVATLAARVFGLRIGPEVDPHAEEDAAVKAEGDASVQVETQADAPTSAAATADPGLMRTRIPFGPFLALGALEYLLGADHFVRAYLDLLRGE